jgi:DNA (cytosine-5)-methyltransferase 1
MKILDLFCGAGGAAMGLHQAFPEAEIVGVDIKPQPRYPFKFVQDNALEYPLDGFNFIWSSPPCQYYTQMLNHGLTPRANHPDLIEVTRNLLVSSGLPYVIENVAGAPLKNAIRLCGLMFKLQTLRHRFFESTFTIAEPLHPKHNGKGIRNQRDGGTYYRCYGHETGKRQWGKAMGIDWMKTPELAQAIPPVYSRYIGEQLEKTFDISFVGNGCTRGTGSAASL